MLGVAVSTLASWARAGKVSAALITPGGHRRYDRIEIRALVRERATAGPAEEQMEIDAARLYDQGWSIQQVAAKFDLSYGVMRRILRKRTTLRDRSSRSRPVPGPVEETMPSWQP
jgi:hypothetical protein